MGKINVEDACLYADSAVMGLMGAVQTTAPGPFHKAITKDSLVHGLRDVMTQHDGAGKLAITAANVLTAQDAGHNFKKKYLVVRGASNLACAGLQAFHLNENKYKKEPFTYGLLGLGAALGATQLFVGLRKDSVL